MTKISVELRHLASQVDDWDGQSIWFGVLRHLAIVHITGGVMSLLTGYR